MKARYQTAIEEKLEVLQTLQKTDYFDVLDIVYQVIADCFYKGKKVILAGNGGSASDAQHFAGELMGRFEKNRMALPAVALTSDSSVMTCIGNDYGFEQSFARQIEGLGHAGDVFFAISTSGNSGNIIKAVECAKKKGMKTVLLSGRTGGVLAGMCDYKLLVPSEHVSRIQEIHIFTIHTLCELIDEDFSKGIKNIGSDAE